MKLEGKSLKSDFLKFIIPSIIAQWVFTLYTMVDGIFVARGVSETALTAVNLSFPFVSGMFSISILFAVGTSTVVAILLGEKKLQRANEVFTQNFVVLIVISLVITALVRLNLDSFAKFLGATDASLSYVKEYLHTLAPFAVFFILSYSFETLIKTDGFPKRATIVVTVGAVSNCILDYLLVIVMQKGVFGAALATGLSQMIVVIIYLWHFLRKKGSIQFVKFRMDWKLLWREMKNGISSGVTEFSAGIITFFFNQAILAYIGEGALVSYTIISYLNSIVVMSMAGIAQGYQPLVSYYYGQQKLEKCRRLLRYGITAAVVISIAALAVCSMSAEGIVSLFVSKELAELRTYSVHAFRIFSISYLVVGYNVVIGGYFTAVERPMEAIAISFARGFVFMMLSLAVMAQLFGGEGIWWSSVVSEILCLGLTLILYLRYHFQHRSKKIKNK